MIVESKEFLSNNAFTISPASSHSQGKKTISFPIKKLTMDDVPLFTPFPGM